MWVSQCVDVGVSVGVTVCGCWCGCHSVDTGVNVFMWVSQYGYRCQCVYVGVTVGVPVCACIGVSLCCCVGCQCACVCALWCHNLSSTPPKQPQMWLSQCVCGCHNVCVWLSQCVCVVVSVCVCWAFVRVRTLCVCIHCAGMCIVSTCLASVYMHLSVLVFVFQNPKPQSNVATEICTGVRGAGREKYSFK